MKYFKWLFWVGVFFVFKTDAVASKAPAVIEGTINGLVAGKKAFIAKRTGEFTQDTLAQTTIKEGGKFTLFLTDKQLNELYELQFEGVRLRVLLVGEKGKIAISGEVNDIFSIQVSGTPENDRYDSYKHFVYGLTKGHPNFLVKKPTKCIPNYLPQMFNLIQDNPHFSHFSQICPSL